MSFKKALPYIATLLVLAGLIVICLTSKKDVDPDPTESTSITTMTETDTSEYTPSPAMIG